jgi:hypothetical protein
VRVIEAELHVERESQSGVGLSNPDEKSVDLIATVQQGKRKQVLRWALQYSVIPTIPTLRDSFDIGMHSERALVINYTLELPLSAEVRDIRVSPHLNWAVKATDRQGEPHSANKNKIKTLTLTWKGARSPRRIEDLISITPILDSGVALDSRQFKLRGEISADVSPNPPAILLGRVGANTRIEEQIALQSLTATKFEILDARMARLDRDLKLSKLEHAHFVLTGKCQGSMDYSNLLLFTVRQNGGQDYTISVPIRYESLE